jgi:(S)-sulfolactate dehydrogenase
MPDIIVSEFMDPAAVGDLEGEFSVHYDAGLWQDREKLAALVADALALIVRNRTRVDRALIDGARRLKVVGRLGVGLDNIDVVHARQRGIAVEAAVGSNAASVAEYVIAASFMLRRWPAYALTGEVIAGRWPREAAGKGRELAGRRLGLVGFGSIGQTVARLAGAVGLMVAAHDDYLPADHPAWSGVERLELEPLLTGSDIVSLHCPLTPATRHLLDARRLALIPKGSLLINTARGTVADEAAVAAALRSGHLAGAALDTFEPEPVDEPTRSLFAGLPNVLLTPHVAGVTVESNVRASAMTAANVRRVLKGGA